jgi:hypothetical protein
MVCASISVPTRPLTKSHIVEGTLGLVPDADEDDMRPLLYCTAEKLPGPLPPRLAQINRAEAAAAEGRYRALRSHP